MHAEDLVIVVEFLRSGMSCLRNNEYEQNMNLDKTDVMLVEKQRGVKHRTGIYLASKTCCVSGRKYI